MIKLQPAVFSDRGVVLEQLADAPSALARIKQLIPAKSSVMHGSSQTLEAIGLLDYLAAGQHGWNYLKQSIEAEADQSRRSRLRRESALADYYLGSVHAIAATGELVWLSGSGSQLPAYAFTAANVIWVASNQKVVADLPAALRFSEEVSLVKHRQRLGKDVENGKTLIFHRELPRGRRQLRLLLIDQPLGYVP